MRLRTKLALFPTLVLAGGLAATALHAQKADAPAAPPAAEAPAAAPTPMLAHRAAYRLTLDHARENAGIASANGAMIYEQVDACDGWATRQRLQLVLTDRDGQDVDSTSDYSTYESKDGRHLRFSLTQTQGGAVSQRVAGEATLEADGSGTVRYTEPEAREERLPAGTLLPMLHTERVLAAARGGQRIFMAPLFDGTSPDGAQDTTTAITGWTAPAAVERFPLLSPLGSARMRVAFFNRGPVRQRGGENDRQRDNGGAASPEYEIALRYWENGVADQLGMDFGDFVVNGRLEQLAPIPASC